MSTQQKDMFQAFGITGFSLPAKEEKSKKADKKKESSSTRTSKAIKEKISGLAATVIKAFPITVAYARSQDVYTRDDFEKEGEITLEDLRQLLLLDYPEFDTDKVKMNYNKEKAMIIPYPAGGKLGSMLPTPINSWKDGGDTLPEILEDIADRFHITEFDAYYVKNINNKQYVILSADNGNFWASHGQQEASHVFCIGDNITAKHSLLKGITGIDLLFVRASVGDQGLKEAIIECMKRF